jgi:hypothetical protein
VIYHKYYSPPHPSRSAELTAEALSPLRVEREGFLKPTSDRMG